MKKIVLAFAFMLITQLGFAQDEASKKDIMKVLEVSGATAQIKLVKDQILKMVPTEKQAAFIIEYDATLPALYDKMAQVYIETYTKEDIKAMLAFYESPIGKKITAKTAEIAEKNIPATQEWSQGLQGMMMKYMQ